jgi:hypothetical protein
LIRYPDERRIGSPIFSPRGSSQTHKCQQQHRIVNNRFLHDILTASVWAITTVAIRLEFAKVVSVDSESHDMRRCIAMLFAAAFGCQGFATFCVFFSAIATRADFLLRKMFVLDT